MDKGALINPLDVSFERKRILLNEFVLPSHTIIENKTFIDCDLIGPANIYFHSSNNASPYASLSSTLCGFLLKPTSIMVSSLGIVFLEIALFRG